MNPYTSNSILIPQALLIPPSSSSSSSHTGSCLVSWTSKNLPTSVFFESTSLNLNLLTHQKKTASVLHGIEALKLDSTDLEFPKLIPVSIEEITIKPIRRIFKPSQQNDPMNELQDQVTFNLSLTEQQRTDRDQVQLPFLPKRNQDGIVIQAPGEIYDGSFQPQSKSNGLIVYEPDSADDMDNEEPDDEL
ncbi:uncharacterized protein MELLADRAFT_53183 [Melampsora larici-populina 98AG31]|uniref:Elongator complex protein 5 n=1 Tax=Melampsora larici-populina (strain 98AG31 / pathotype 3-4-7) TaxID=747676 RepID=F4RVD0_MELLP|nr:uncharacterized protein MELLADRAFT_53183 [Melampsora larici-populina 98AG31]EGG03690.1 hypothetical protein MELLADRAFT_53183 [Melampsora larici-populina 98AG31]